jgi:septal ring factor EnvC (AmiA/AmiB activator)
MFTSIIAKLKPFLPYIIGGTFLLLMIFGIKSCMVAKNYYISLGQYQAKIAILEPQIKSLSEDNLALQKSIKESNKKIDDILANANKPSTSEIEKDKTIANLKKDLDKYKEQGDYKTALDKSEDMVKEYIEKFSLAEQRHKDAIFGLNKEWQEKYDKQVNIGINFKTMYEDEHVLRLQANNTLYKVTADFSIAKTWGVIKIVAIIGLAADVFYNIFLKKK